MATSLICIAVDCVWPWLQSVCEICRFAMLKEYENLSLCSKFLSFHVYLHFTGSWDNLQPHCNLHLASLWQPDDENMDQAFISFMWLVDPKSWRNSDSNLNLVSELCSKGYCIELEESFSCIIQTLKWDVVIKMFQLSIRLVTETRTVVMIER